MLPSIIEYGGRTLGYSDSSAIESEESNQEHKLGETLSCAAVPGIFYDNSVIADEDHRQQQSIG
jgi:hypothetical protein